MKYPLLIYKILLISDIAGATSGTFFENISSSKISLKSYSIYYVII